MPICVCWRIFCENLVGHCDRLGRCGPGAVDFARRVVDWPDVHHSSRRSMKPASAVQSGASVQAREATRPTLSSEAPVFSSATSPGQVPEKFDASRSGLSLPTTPSTVCGAKSSGRRLRSSGRRSDPAWRSPRRGGSGIPPRRSAIHPVSGGPRPTGRSSRAIAPAPIRSACCDSLRPEDGDVLGHLTVVRCSLCPETHHGRSSTVAATSAVSSSLEFHLSRW